MERNASNALAVGVANRFHVVHPRLHRLKRLRQVRVRTRILWVWSVLKGCFAHRAVSQGVKLVSVWARVSLSVLRSRDLSLDLILLLFDILLKRMGLLLKLVLLELEQRLLFQRDLELALDLVNLLLVVLLANLELLDVVRDVDLVLIDRDLMRLVVVTFLPQLFPG